MRRAIAFLTPFGGAAVPDARTLAWFPLAGAAIGGVVGLVWLAASEIWPPVIAAAVVVAVDLALTGLLHLDGAVDCADGLLPHLDRDRRLAVMKEPTVGAFGVGVAGLALLLRFAAFAGQDESVFLIAGLWCASRSAMAVVAWSLPYARAGAGGLASAFLGGQHLRWPVAGAGTALALLLVAGGSGWAGLAALAGLAAAVAGVVVFAHRRLGGFTGDVLGAAGFAGETVALLVAAARW